jgi:hypothetical protein
MKIAADDMLRLLTGGVLQKKSLLLKQDLLILLSHVTTKSHSRDSWHLLYIGRHFTHVMYQSMALLRRLTNTRA